MGAGTLAGVVSSVLYVVLKCGKSNSSVRPAIKLLA